MLQCVFTEDRLKTAGHYLACSENLCVMEEGRQKRVFTEKYCRLQL